MIVTLATTAMQAFQALQRDERVFSHANQVKNMLAQFGIAAGIALATLCMQWRSTVRFERLNESLSPSNPALAPALEQLTRHFAVLRNPAEAAQFASGAAGPAGDAGGHLDGGARLLSRRDADRSDMPRAGDGRAAGAQRADERSMNPLAPAGATHAVACE